MIRRAEGISPLPAPRAGVIGLLQHEGAAVPVVSVLAPAGAHVLVVEPHAGTPIAVLVEEVLGVTHVPTNGIGPPPGGQAAALLYGTVRVEGDLVLLVDVDALARSVA